MKSVSLWTVNSQLNTDSQSQTLAMLRSLWVSTLQQLFGFTSVFMTQFYMESSFCFKPLGQCCKLNSSGVDKNRD